MGNHTRNLVGICMQIDCRATAGVMEPSEEDIKPAPGSSTKVGHLSRKTAVAGAQ